MLSSAPEQDTWKRAMDLQSFEPKWTKLQENFPPPENFFLPRERQAFFTRSGALEKNRRRSGEFCIS